MSGTTEQARGTVAPVRRTITVHASAEQAWDVFTAEMDSWWPREHHIGTSPMVRMVVEPSVGGRCYSVQEDGTDCDWGSVLEWDPPRRLVLAWRITTQWKFEPDLWKSSEVDVRFVPMADGTTRVDLEHRHIERHGAGFEGMRTAVDSPNGWGRTLALFAERVDGASTAAKEGKP